jgi:hypothetical protein
VLWYGHSSEGLLTDYGILLLGASGELLPS